jgi:hypothetical protein
MAIKISELANLTAYTDSVFIPVVETAGNTFSTVKSTSSELKTYVLGTIPSEISDLTANTTAQATAIYNAEVAIVTANIGQIGYTDNKVLTANIGQIGYTDNKVTTANIGQIGYTDNKVSTANVAMKGYVDFANTTMTSYVNDVATRTSYGNANVTAFLPTYNGTIATVTNANIGQIGYTDNKVTTANIGQIGYTLNQINISNIGTIGYIAQQINISNVGQIGYTDNKVSVANIGQIGYTNDRVTTANIGQIGYTDNEVLTANIGQIGYTDNKVTTANIGQIGFTNETVTQANVGMKGYVDQEVIAAGGYSNVNTTAFLVAASVPINTSANVSGAIVNAGAATVTGTIAGAIGTFTGNVIGGQAQFSALNSTPVGNAVASTGTFTTLTVPSVTKNGTDGVGDIGQTGNRFAVIYGQSTSAEYADLAEKYVSDTDYDSGTVLEFGGEHEVTLASNETVRVAGIVSTQPAFKMNDDLVADHVVMIALQGRVPCKVEGTIQKGDMLVSAGNGKAKATNNPQFGTVIGKALQEHQGADGIIEVVVGRL